MLRCYRVLVHGALDWPVDAGPLGPGESRPSGFYAHRHVAALSPEAAAGRAFASIRADPDRQTGWFSERRVTLTLSAEEIEEASLFKALLPDNPGHTFY